MSYVQCPQNKAITKLMSSLYFIHATVVPRLEDRRKEEKTERLLPCPVLPTSESSPLYLSFHVKNIETWQQIHEQVDLNTYCVARYECEVEVGMSEYDFASHIIEL